MDYAKEAQENIILKVRVGSHLFGTSTPESDLDFEGIFMPSKSVMLGLGECKEVNLGTVSKDETGRNTKDAVDFKIREYRSFVRLALQNNPNILNILFCNDENVMFENEFGHRLRGIAESFPHQHGLNRFRAYAISQLKKMRIKPGGYDVLKKAQAFLSGCNPKDILVDVIKSKDNYISSLFSDMGPGKHIIVADISLERGLQVKKALSMIELRLSNASSRASNWVKYGYDTKFASNLVQILLQGIELGETGKLEFPLNYSSTILSIKNGSWPLDEVEKFATDRLEELTKLIDGNCKLRKKPNQKCIEDFVIEEMKKWIMLNI